MGTRFRTMLAPINAPTGDGRRFRSGGITLAPTPFPFEWVRSRGEDGHDGAVVVGAVQEVTVATVAQAVKDGWVSAEAAKASGLANKTEAIWARGELLDDADRETMPRLAEDVAEAMTLIGSGVLGPSVDLDSFEAVPVKEGTDEELTWDDLEEAELAGEEIKVELLVTEARVRAATLVSIPAFMETSRPLSLEPEEEDEAASTTEELAALVASVSAPAAPAASVFDAPALDGPTPITIDPDTGQIFGHIAQWRTCHAGYSDVCVTPPREDAEVGYSWFNRFPVETSDGGTVWAGRLTVGGRHPGLSLAASGTMSAYDGKTVAAHVRASEDAHGIVISGVLAPDLDESARRVLSRRKVSGDWRETPAGLSLVELLALSPGPRQHSEPGFPVVATHSRHGRQTALTAALGPEPEEFTPPRRPVVDVDALAAALERRQADRALAAQVRVELATGLKAKADSERAALMDAMGRGHA